MKELYVRCGLYALVDDWWWEEVNRYAWLTDKRERIFTAVKIEGKKSCYQLMLHRLVCGLKAGDRGRVSFVDGDKTNCQERNLIVGSRANGRIKCIDLKHLRPNGRKRGR